MKILTITKPANESFRQHFNDCMDKSWDKMEGRIDEEKRNFCHFQASVVSGLKTQIRTVEKKVPVEKVVTKEVKVPVMASRDIRYQRLYNNCYSNSNELKLDGSEAINAVHIQKSLLCHKQAMAVLGD